MDNRLSNKQLKIMELTIAGLTDKEIARRMGNTTGVIRNHFHKIFVKLNVKNKIEAISVLLETFK